MDLKVDVEVSVGLCACVESTPLVHECTWAAEPR